MEKFRQLTYEVDNLVKQDLKKIKEKLI